MSVENCVLAILFFHLQSARFASRSKLHPFEKKP
jgi:hypothetical protein